LPVGNVKLVLFVSLAHDLFVIRIVTLTVLQPFIYCMQNCWENSRQ